MINGLNNSGALPALERLMQFASQRHRIIANNIANVNTPGYQALDVSVDSFQQQLGSAIDARRAGGGGASGELKLSSTAEVEVKGKELVLKPEPVGHNILFQDGNDRSLERSMQDLVENFMAFRAAAQLMRNQHDVLITAIRERI